MKRELWAGTIGGRFVAVLLTERHSVAIATVLAADEEMMAASLVAPRLKGEPIELEPDDGETFEHVLAEAGFTPEQTAEITAHIPTVLAAR